MPVISKFNVEVPPSVRASLKVRSPGLLPGFKVPLTETAPMIVPVPPKVTPLAMINPLAEASSEDPVDTWMLVLANVTPEARSSVPALTVVPPV